MQLRTRALAAALLSASVALASPPACATEVPARPLFGDTHLHSSYSYDSYTMGNRSGTPDVAYQFAKGLPVVHPSFGTRVRIGRPLDFLVVADHAEYLGVTVALFRKEPEVAGTDTGKRLLEMSQGGNERLALVEMARSMHRGQALADLNRDDVRASAWRQVIDAADRHNEPGRFTTMIGWEWSGFPQGASMHRVVLMADGADVAGQFLPFSTFDSQRPEDLWDWLDATARRTGARFIAIPHNPNESMGRMFAETDFDGQPMTREYAEQRARWEPIVEMTQTKGDSETHPTLSPDDEFADFEKWERPRLPGLKIPPPSSAEYARPALISGLALGLQVGANPFQFGMIGSSDIHTSLSVVDEEQYSGVLSVEGSPLTKTRPLQGGTAKGTYKVGNDFQAAGLAAVWARENTREEIFAALKRREAYATTGPRITLRMFGGWNFRPADARSPNLARIGYERGVPMGGELPPPSGERSPSFLLAAMKDPEGAGLDRLQIVKGWIDADGGRRERVYDVVWSGDRKPQADGRLSRLPDTVDLTTGRHDRSAGSASLQATWVDPDFDPRRPAFYYARVLEVNTPRHTLLDAVATGEPPPEGQATSIQERAYSSPIWYTPR